MSDSERPCVACDMWLVRTGSKLPVKSLYFGNATVNVDVGTYDDRELNVQHRLASRALLSCIPNEGHFPVLLIYRF